MNTSPNAKKINPGDRNKLCSLAPGGNHRPTRLAKFTLAALLLAGAVLAAPPSARASLMAYEGFNYPLGTPNLTGQSGGVGWRGSWQTVNSGSSTVQAGSLVASVNAPANYDSRSTGNAAFTPTGTRAGRTLDTSAGGAFGVKGYVDTNGNIGASGKTIYISFLQQPNAANNNYYEFEFHRANLGDPGRVGGIGNDTSGSSSIYLRTPAAAQTVIGAGSPGVSLYVVRIDFIGTNDTVYVYQNPTSATEPGTPTLLEASAGDLSFNGISLGAFANGRTVVDDEIRLGETWADVVSPGVSSTGAWDGGGANNYWSTAANWDNDMVPIFASSLTFSGGTRLNPTNDLNGVSANNITFDAAAGAFTLSGNSLGLNGNIVFNGVPTGPVTQTIDLPLVPTGDVTVDLRTNGNITINGNITDATGGLTQTSTGNTGTLTLSGTNSFVSYAINGGTNHITGSVAVNLNNNTRFVLANGNSGFQSTLILEGGANLTVSGNSVDAGVIGRDGGIATITQNGGTFSFSITNHPLLLICATGNANSRGTYNMNGGLLDMNGGALAPGLGANGVMVTGIVNQASGVITNVNQLILGYNVGQNGRGIYNLTGGTIYIGANGITSQSGLYNILLGGGTVSASTSWSSALNMTLTGTNGPVTFNPAGNFITLSGVLSGAGGLIVNGPGVLDLAGANTMTGDVSVTTGSTLQFDATGSSAGGLRIATGGTVNLNFSGNYAAGSLYTNGVRLPVGTYNAGNLAGFLSGGGTLQVTTGISTGLWTGLGGNGNWSTAGNWDNNAVPIFPHAVTFAGNMQLNNNNDLSGITISSLTFDSAASAFTLGGNDATLSGAIGFNGMPAAPVTQTVNFNMNWTGDETINLPTNANLTLNGNINSSVNLVKAGAGNLTLGGNDIFAGYIGNGGTNFITGSVAINSFGGHSIYLGNGDTNFNGTIVIQPSGSLTMVGGFDDTFVIGRNGGSGAVIQNGGTFTFSPSTARTLLIGATSSPGTKAEYDMNGGVFDMGGNTLGVALGDNNVVYTASLNQTGGVIQNLFKLDLGALRNFGHGVFNLTGGTINIDLGGITSDDGSYEVNLGGGTVGASSGWSSTLNMTLTGSNGPVTFNTSGNTVALSGVLSGPGGLIVTGGGILDLGGANTYLGDTTVSNGFLQLDTTGSSAGAFRVVDGGIFSLNFSGNYAVPALYTNGVPLPQGSYSSANLPTFIAGSGTLQVVGAISTGHWTGLGANNNWSTSGNWDNNAVPVFPHALTFAGSTRLNNNNDLSSITVSGFTFDSAAGPFVLGGNDITLTGTIGFNGTPATPVTQTINFGMTLPGDVTFNVPTNANLALNGNLSSGGWLTKLGDGTLTLGGTDTFGAYSVDGGTNVITGNVTFNGNGNEFYVADGHLVGNGRGTVVIQPGATLSVLGNYGDAGVLGRDSGTGIIVQNGGTFSFNPANQIYLFIGASSSTATHSEYDMNGGLFDMNNKTLGIALGAGVTITCSVNQSGGVITNVGQLYLSPLTQQGHGIYNLTGGSIYIGQGGITNFGGTTYEVYLGGGTVGAYASWVSTLDMTLSGVNGPVTFDTAGNTITLSGALSGAGGLAVNGGGTVDLSGANTYTGATIVNAGTLILENENNHSGSFQAFTGGTLELNYSGNLVVASFSTNNVALPSGTYNAGNLPGFITGTGSIQVGGSLPTTPTNISISSTPGHLLISWPANYQGWILQQNTNSLNVAPVWTDIAGTAGLTSTNISVNPALPKAFYRLRYPTP